MCYLKSTKAIYLAFIKIISNLSIIICFIEIWIINKNPSENVFL